MTYFIKFYNLLNLILLFSEKKSNKKKLDKKKHVHNNVYKK